ncbi:MAG: hypothetical protein DLM57_03020 [Pseudonocardiales bacterium]|nr:MAG: hypothetical protein DLM57_03020 [Pseudonocardiales bacterium]
MGPLSVHAIADAPGGFGNADLCNTETVTPSSGVHQFGERTIDGRVAEYRLSSWTCPSHNYQLEQYTVFTFPAFVFLDELPQYRAVFENMIARATLPRQSRPLALNDNGTVTAVTSTATGYRVTLDRAAWTGLTHGFQSEHVTVTYQIPATVLQPQTPIRVGAVWNIETDGDTVTGAYPATI